MFVGFCVSAWDFQVEIKEPADGQWGRQMENGSWTGVVTTLGFLALIFVVALALTLSWSLLSALQLSLSVTFAFTKLSLSVAFLFTKLKCCMLVGTVENRQADLSMNLALTGAREKVIDYSAPYIGSCLRLCLCVWRSSGTTLLPIKNRPLSLY